MKHSSPQNRKNVWLLRVLVIALIATALYAVDLLNKTARIYETTSSAIAAQPVVASTAALGDNTIKIPSYDMFKAGNLWTLVSKKRPLEKEAGFKLVAIPVRHGDEDLPMKVAVDITDELEQLINAADADEEPLMISSAYRSLAEQKEIYDDFVAESGEAVAKQYVSPVGASEHHTGLSVDLSSLSDECLEDSDSCSLSQSGAAWLAENAYKYGFIQRYPQGDQAITGVAFEPWHYRFVGKPLANAMNETGLTFDEVVELLAPGYARTRL